MRTLYLKPRGEPDPLCRWTDSRPKRLHVVEETDALWRVQIKPGLIVDFPKYAWENVWQVED